MKTMTAKTESARDRLPADMAKRDVEAIQRDTDNPRWTITRVLGGTARVIGAVALFS